LVEFFDLGGGGEAEEALEGQIEDPEVLGGHHEVDSFVDFDAEDYLVDVDADGGDFLYDGEIAGVGKGEVLVFMEDFNAVFEDINGLFDDEVG
jgi:hypothetical protein